jgi:hypothetical protein
VPLTPEGTRPNLLLERSLWLVETCKLFGLPWTLLLRLLI